MVVYVDVNISIKTDYFVKQKKKIQCYSYGKYASNLFQPCYILMNPGSAIPFLNSLLQH